MIAVGVQVVSSVRVGNLAFHLSQERRVAILHIGNKRYRNKIEAENAVVD